MGDQRVVFHDLDGHPVPYGRTLLLGRTLEKGARGVRLYDGTLDGYRKNVVALR